jgi:monoterpene epsilon-lactone hydrolase
MSETRFNPDGTSLQIPARTIPIPSTISPQAQQALALAASRDHGRVGLPDVWPPQQDKAGWKKVIAQIDNQIAAMTSLLPPFPGTIVARPVGSATVYELTPNHIPDDKRDRAIIALHGGGYCLGGGELAAQVHQMFAALCRTKVYALDYRMPPDHPHPAALDDVVDLYRDVLTRHAPGKVALIGTSAGGGLVGTGILKIRDLGLPLPAAAVMCTPSTDLAETGDTFETNKFVDTTLKQRTPALLKLYAGDHDLRDPYVSALYGDLTRGFSPTMLVSGTRDLLLSNTVLFHRALRRAGITAELHVFEALPHGVFGGAPEDMEAMQEQIQFIDRMLK